MNRMLNGFMAALLATVALPVLTDDIDAWWSTSDQTRLRVELALYTLARNPVCTLGLDCRQQFTAATYLRLQSLYDQGAVITEADAALSILHTVLVALPSSVVAQTTTVPTSGSAVSVAGQVYLSLVPTGEAPTPNAQGCQRDYLVALSSAPSSGALLLSLKDPVQFERQLAEALSGTSRWSGSMASSAFLVPAGESSTSAVLLRAIFDVGPAPGWAGNVKKLLMPAAVSSAQALAASSLPEVVDSIGEPALVADGPRRGRLREGALSFWTNANDVLPGLAPTILAGFDGDAVRRGGAGQRIPGSVAGASAATVVGPSHSGRQLFTQALDALGEHIGPAPLVRVEATMASASRLRASLQAADDVEALGLLQWLLGWDIDEAPQRSRSWLLGPVFHSQPLALNYGASGAGYSVSNPHIQIFYGSSDGILHVLENTDAAGRESGRERYGFMPRQFLGNVAQRRSNTAGAVVPNYGVDGSPVALRVDHNGDGNLRVQDGDEALVYVGLRRGGTHYYALDVADPSQPPRMQWSIGPESGGDFAALGLSFSTPLVGRVRYGGQVHDVLIFGGGYHGGRDPATGEILGKDAGAGDDPRGNAIYMVDARTGELVWRAVRGAIGSVSNTEFAHPEMRDSIPSDITALTDAAGIIHRLYVGDTGGRVWRVDLPQGATVDPDHRANHWFVSLFAELGAATVGEHDRRFFHAPALVQSLDPSGFPVDGVLIVSGDRANPSSTHVKDYAFYLRDRATRSGDAQVRQRPPVALEALAGAEACGVHERDAGCDLVASAGWTMALAAPGEKGWGRPMVDGGRALFNTFTPRSTPCSPPPGRARMYAVSLANGAVLHGQATGVDIGMAMPAEMQRIGDYIVLPSAGPQGDVSGTGLVSGQPLQRSLAPQLIQTYWRELGVDPL
ncbi:MAG: PilC/PilY family type IV pilus protein [Haliea sp.]|nr:PilC/PilY family type IV pilus protein [Haliea sp.]